MSDLPLTLRTLMRSYKDTVEEVHGGKSTKRQEVLSVKY